MGSLVLAALCAGGCDSGGAGGRCVATLGSDCAALYAPSWDEIYARTIAPTCAQGGSSCHAAEGGQGGLTMATSEGAYEALLGFDGGPARVIAGDAACSELVHRIASVDASEQMPPGAPMSDEERCVIERWIDAGAER